jgi:opacity protein-like surface antigen
MKRLFAQSLLATAIVLAAGSGTPAAADWIFTPFIGSTLNPGAEISGIGDFTDNLGERVTFGATATWMGAGIIGFEIDFGSTPNYFEIEAGPDGFDFGDGNVTTLQGNLVLGAPIGGQSGPGFRPYGSAGLGLLRTNIDAGDFLEGVSSNDLGANFGFGAHIFFSDDIGIKGDLRYFRALQQDDGDFSFEDFDFWRATVGLSFRFGN